jgi:hypothetical protein
MTYWQRVFAEAQRLILKAQANGAVLSGDDAYWLARNAVDTPLLEATDAGQTTQDAAS